LVAVSVAKFVIVSRFGTTKAEARGNLFLHGKGIDFDIPVLIVVNHSQRPAWQKRVSGAGGAGS